MTKVPKPLPPQCAYYPALDEDSLVWQVAWFCRGTMGWVPQPSLGRGTREKVQRDCDFLNKSLGLSEADVQEIWDAGSSA